MLKRRGKCDTYLTHLFRYCWSKKSPVKRWNKSFQPILWLSSAVDFYSWWQLEQKEPDEKMKYKEFSVNTVLAERSLYFIFSLDSFCSNDIYRRESDRCRTLLFFLTFLSFHLSQFSYYVNIFHVFKCAFHPEISSFFW